MTKEIFDEVYVVPDRDASRSLINNLMMNYFSDSAFVGSVDRFLFYYSGHGGDYGSDVGYMFISEKKKDNKFDDDNSLPFTTLQQWSTKLTAKHVLFLLDGCVTGLGLVSKDGTTAKQADNAAISEEDGEGFKSDSIYSHKGQRIGVRI